MLARAVIVAVILGCAPRPAGADGKPWAVGVSEERKTRANQLLEQGNALFLEKNYPAALERYRRAIAVWDHPAIRFNIVRCLVQLDRPVEALDNLELALQYGSAPLEDSVYTEALAYQKMLVKQVAEVTVECKQPAVALVLDGKPLPACPMVETRRLEPGHHQLVGTREGYQPKLVDVTAIGGAPQRIAVELRPVAVATTYSHRWASWKPWALFGSSIAVAAIGGGFEVRAFGRMRDYDNAVAAACPDGCLPGEGAPSTHDRDLARRDNAVGIAGIAIGAVGATIGGVMLYANRDRVARDVAVVPINGGALVVLGDRW